MESTVSQHKSEFFDIGEARIQKLIGQASSFNGYEREAAVISIKQLDAPQFLPILIRRANDWVRSVSTHATDALISLLRTENQAFFIEKLPDIFHLTKCARRDHSQLIAAVTRFLLEEDQKLTLINAIGHHNPKISGIAFRLSRSHHSVPKDELLLRAIKSNNIAVIRAGAQLINDIEDTQFLILYPELIRHQCNVVTSRTIKRLNILAPQKIEKLSGDLIFNRDIEIRKIARHYLSLGGLDALTIYRRELNDSATPLYKRRIALIGICEISIEESSYDLERAKISTQPSLRSLAITNLVKLKGEEGRSIAITGFFDESSKVVSESAIAFIKQGFQCSVEELLQLMLIGKSADRFETAMFLAKKGNKWDHIIFLFELMKRQLVAEELIRKNYVQWHTNYNRRQTQPSRQQLVRLRDFQLKDEAIASELAQMLEVF